MKSYTFAPISAREYPTVKILDNPYIWGGVQLCINVSEKPYSPELMLAMRKKGISWFGCSVSEEEGEDWFSALKMGLRFLLTGYLSSMKMVVHCDFGNNRSRTFVEALYYVLKGEQFPDEYKGEYNHLIYNSKQGHLPPVEKLEEFLNAMRYDVIEVTQQVIKS